MQRVNNIAYLKGILLFFFIFPILSFLISLLVCDVMTAFFYSRLTYWLSLLSLYFYSKKIEQGDFLIWHEEPYHLKFYLLSILVLLVLSFFTSAFVNANLRLYFLENHKIGEALYSKLKINKFALITGVLTAGFTEELIFRAYVLPRLNVLSGNRFIAIIISSLMFSSIHIQYGGYAKCIYTFFLGMLCSVHYVKYKNIKILILFHCTLDFIAYGLL